MTITFQPRFSTVSSRPQFGNASDAWGSQDKAKRLARSTPYTHDLYLALSLDEKQAVIYYRPLPLPDLDRNAAFQAFLSSKAAEKLKALFEDANITFKLYGET